MTECGPNGVIHSLRTPFLRQQMEKYAARDQFALCSLMLGLEFLVFHKDPHETPLATPL